MTAGLVHVSLFAGVGGIDLAAETVGIPTVLACEADKAARGVLHDRFPDTILHPDVRKLTADDLRAAGAIPARTIISAGWPCQGNSVAGRRSGMADPRSGLWRHVVRLLADFRPAWFLGENVPGLLSVNDGDDFGEVLNDLNTLGYLVDPNIYDAQYFGVPQRRRRVVLVCQHVDHSLSRKTITSALTLAQCLIEISLLTLIVRSQGYASASSPWDSLENCVAGLQQRMTLYGMERPRDELYKIWLPNLAGESARRALAYNVSDLDPGDSTSDAHAHAAATSSRDMTLPEAVTSLSTESSWKQLLDVLLPMARSCITSTPSRTTTTPPISTCARGLLSISGYIAALSDSSPNFSGPASSASTAVRVLTNYARATDGNLFAELDGVHDLPDLIPAAERALATLGRAGDNGRAPAQVLLEPQGSRRDPTQSDQAGQDAATRAPRSAGRPRVLRTLTTRAGATYDDQQTDQLVVSSLTAAQGGPDDNDAQAGHLIPYQKIFRSSYRDAEGDLPAERWAERPQAATLSPHDLGSDARAVELVVCATGDRTHTLTAEGHDASEDGTGRGTPIIAATLTAGTSQPGVSAPGRRQEDDHNLTVTTTSVRRLTPLECERLQGWPDGHTATSWGRPQADSPRYQQTGNGVATPVFAWVMAGIVAQHACEVAA